MTSLDSELEQFVAEHAVGWWLSAGVRTSQQLSDFVYYYADTYGISEQAQRERIFQRAWEIARHYHPRA